MKFWLDNTHALDSTARQLGFALMISFAVSMNFAGSAWAFDTHHAHLDDPVLELSGADTAFSTNLPSPSVADSCLPLLKSIRHVNPNTAMDRNQRSAGQAASLGFIFGVRFALSPPKKLKSSHHANARFDVWQPQAFAGNRQALAVSAYRQCQKDKALKALGALGR